MKRERVRRLAIGLPLAVAAVLFALDGCSRSRGGSTTRPEALSAPGT